MNIFLGTCQEYQKSYTRYLAGTKLGGIRPEPIFTYTIGDWLAMRIGTNNPSLLPVRYFEIFWSRLTSKFHLEA